MLRDLPRIYVMMFVVVIIILSLGVFAANNFWRGSDVLELNDIILTSAVSEMDQLSRLSKGTFVLKDSFETKAWETLSNKYPKDSIVQFDYLFDEDDDLHTIPENKLGSPSYKIGSANSIESPSLTSSVVYSGQPVKAIRLKVRRAGDDLAGPTGWTYTGTVTLDAESK